MLIHRDIGMSDVLSIGSQRDCVVVLPTLVHALYWWPRVIAMFKDSHGENYIRTTKTAVISNRTHTALRLWVPYAREPTMPMDFRHEWKYHVEYLILYRLHIGELWL